MIGREAERAVIEGCLDADRPGSLLIDGEAGIGKSTLWSFALEHAAARGRRVLSWRASPAEQDLAFSVLTALFDREAIVDAFPRLAAPRRRALEVALGRVDPGPEPAELSLVGLATADLLRLLAADGPLVVGVDDLQWIDAASEAAIAFAARRLAADTIVFVLARRTSAASVVAATAAPADRAGQTLATAVELRERIEVGPMSVGALGRLIHERLGVAHPRPLLVRVHDAAVGNPFVALEISQSMLARIRHPAPGEPFPVLPEAIPLVRDHLAALTRDARRAVVIVAMSPDPSLGLVERLLGDVGTRAVDEACEKGALVADGARLRAAHPLFASTAYADAPPGERRALRLALAELADDPVERAVHLAAITDGPDDGVARALAEAGRIALGRGAPGTAADLLDRSAGLSRAADERAAILIEAAGAATAAGDLERAETRLRTVLDEVPHGRLRAEALLALGDVVYVERPNEALPLLVSALDHTGGDPLLEAVVHSHITSMADMEPETGRRSALAAVDILERPGLSPEPDHLACALLDRAFHWLLEGDRVAWADIDQGIALMSGTGTSFVARRAQELAERCLWHLGRLGEAIAFDEAEHRRMTDRGQAGLLPPLDQSLSVLHLMTGDWDAARRYATECMDLVEQGEEVWRERALMARARILAWEGDLDGARSIGVDALARQEAAGDRWEATIFCALLGFVELSVPDPAAAVRNLLKALEHADAMEVVLPTQFRFLGDLVEAAVLGGDLDLAERVLEQRLEEPSRRLPLPWVLAMAARGRGMLTAARGDLDGAVRSFDRAIEVFDSALAMPFERARTLLARGQVHRRAGHRRAAREDLGAGLAVFETLGARAWTSRAALELARIGGRTRGGVTLTASERQVAELAANGRSNREIAAELVVSVRTVESQLSAAYRKLDVRSRGQLAAALSARPGPGA